MPSKILRQFIERRQFIEMTVHRTDSSWNDNLSNDSLSNRQFIEPTGYWKNLSDFTVPRFFTVWLPCCNVQLQS